MTEFYSLIVIIKSSIYTLFYKIVILLYKARADNVEGQIFNSSGSFGDI